MSWRLSWSPESHPARSFLSSPASPTRLEQPLEQPLWPLCSPRTQRAALGSGPLHRLPLLGDTPFPAQALADSGRRASPHGPLHTTRPSTPHPSSAHSASHQRTGDPELPRADGCSPGARSGRLGSARSQPRPGGPRKPGPACSPRSVPSRPRQDGSSGARGSAHRALCCPAGTRQAVNTCKPSDPHPEPPLSDSDIRPPRRAAPRQDPGPQRQFAGPRRPSGR